MYTEDITVPFVDHTVNMLNDDYPALPIFDHFIKGQLTDYGQASLRRQQYLLCPNSSCVHWQIAANGYFCEQNGIIFLAFKIFTVVFR